jgi:hypothetical protein
MAFTEPTICKEYSASGPGAGYEPNLLRVVARRNCVVSVSSRRLLPRLLQRALLALSLLAIAPRGAAVDVRAAAALVLDAGRVEAEPERAPVRVSCAPAAVAAAAGPAPQTAPTPLRSEVACARAPLFLKHCAWLC